MAPWHTRRDFLKRSVVWTIGTTWVGSALDALAQALLRAALAGPARPERVQEIARARSVQFHEASVAVAELHADGQLDESVLQQLVEENNFDGIAAALSLMCDLPLGPVERALAQGYYEQILLFAKATELSWNITLELIRFQASGKQLSQGEMDQYFASYTRMQVKTAKAALQFYRLRASASGT